MDYRCGGCQKLLFKATGEAVVAVKCPRCKSYSHLSVKNAPPEDRESQAYKDKDSWRKKPTHPLHCPL